MNFGWKFLDDYEELGNGNRGKGKEKEKGEKEKGKGKAGNYTSRSRYRINALDFKISSALFSLLPNSQSVYK